MLKNTETLWRAYGRQLGFEDEDIEIEALNTDSPSEYSETRFNESGNYPTSRINLALNLRSARWYSQPISSPAALLQEYIEQTRPAHIVVHSLVLEANEDTVSVYTSNYSGYECERTCRISF